MSEQEQKHNMMIIFLIIVIGVIGYILFQELSNTDMTEQERVLTFQIPNSQKYIQIIINQTDSSLYDMEHSTVFFGSEEWKLKDLILISDVIQNKTTIQITKPVDKQTFDRCVKLTIDMVKAYPYDDEQSVEITGDMDVVDTRTEWKLLNCASVEHLITETNEWRNRNE